jgi:hypothetical protein
VKAGVTHTDDLKGRNCWPGRWAESIEHESFRGREGFGNILAGRQCAVVLAHQGGRRVVAYGPQCRDDGLVPEVIPGCGRE